MLVVPLSSIKHFLIWVTGKELSEDPKDFIADGQPVAGDGQRVGQMDQMGFRTTPMSKKPVTTSSLSLRFGEVTVTIVTGDRISCELDPVDLDRSLMKQARQAWSPAVRTEAA